MARVQRDTPVLFFNTGAADREAYLLLKTSGIPCEFRAPTLEEPTPLLLVGYQRLVGIDEIKAFIAGLQGRKNKAKIT